MEVKYKIAVSEGKWWNLIVTRGGVLEAFGNDPANFLFRNR